MSADFENEIPNFGATFDILKTECIILSIQFGPNDERVCRHRVSHGSGKEESHTCLSLIDIVCSHCNLQEYLLCLFRFGDELSFPNLLIVLSRAKCSTKVTPILTHEFINLYDVSFESQNMFAKERQRGKNDEKRNELIAGHTQKEE